MSNDNIDEKLDVAILKATEITKNKGVEPLYDELSNSPEDPINKSISYSNRIIDAINFVFTEYDIYKTRLQIAKNLLDVLSIEEIAKATGLTIEEVKKLAGK